MHTTSVVLNRPLLQTIDPFQSRSTMAGDKRLMLRGAKSGLCNFFHLFFYSPSR